MVFECDAFRLDVLTRKPLLFNGPVFRDTYKMANKESK